MPRFVLCAVFVSVGTVAFGQSNLHPAPAPEPGFNFRGPQFAPSAAAAPLGAVHSCLGLHQDRTGAQAGLDQLFQIPCLDAKTHTIIIARNEVPTLQPPKSLSSHAKGEPIPTQWPKARVEQIPTQWPDLKMQLIDRSLRTIP